MNMLTPPPPSKGTPNTCEHVDCLMITVHFVPPRAQGRIRCRFILSHLEPRDVFDVINPCQTRVEVTRMGCEYRLRPPRSPRGEIDRGGALSGIVQPERAGGFGREVCEVPGRSFYVLLQTRLVRKNTVAADARPTLTGHHYPAACE